ncbi:uncharacterized protein [Diadema antillarum]|uniref:uncharacterized protein isoform X2 n=1 Tax=Diadema antillarum TaxID=105358 RepID=UPI003A887BC1
MTCMMKKATNTMTELTKIWMTLSFLVGKGMALQNADLPEIDGLLAEDDTFDSSSAQTQPSYVDMGITFTAFQPDQDEDFCADQVSSNNVGFLKAFLVIIVISVICIYIASMAVCLKSRYQREDLLETVETLVNCKCIQSLESLTQSRGEGETYPALHAAEEESSTSTKAKTTTIVSKIELISRPPLRRDEDPTLAPTESRDDFDIGNARKTRVPSEDKSQNGHNETVTQVIPSSRKDHDVHGRNSPSCRVADVEVATKAYKRVVEGDKPMEDVIDVDVFRPPRSRECTSTNTTRSSATLRDRPGTYYENVPRAYQGF